MKCCTVCLAFSLVVGLSGTSAFAQAGPDQATALAAKAMCELARLPASSANTAVETAYLATEATRALLLPLLTMEQQVMSRTILDLVYDELNGASFDTPLSLVAGDNNRAEGDVEFGAGNYGDAISAYMVATQCYFAAAARVPYVTALILAAQGVMLNGPPMP